jgi:lipoate-protein ligase B
MPASDKPSSTSDPLDSPASAESDLHLPACQYWWTGRISYPEARQLQEGLAHQIAVKSLPPTLLLLEHPHTYTLGRSAQPGNLLWDAETLSQRGVEVHQIDRGGDITYHGPGQLVGYPLLPLGRPTTQAGNTRIPQADYVGYLRRLEDMLILALSRFGLEGVRIPGKTGVWVRHEDKIEKVASIGIKVDAQGISRHGFALNIDTDMRYWQGIVACGLPDDRMTNLAQLLSPSPTIQQVCQAVIPAFGECFHYHMVKYP